VTRIVDGARQPSGPESGSHDHGAEAAPGASAAPAAGPARSLVVSVLVLGETCTRLSADKGYQPRGQVSPEQVAEVLRIDPASDYARRTAELYTCLSALPANAPVAPTAEELADLVARGKAAGVIPADVTTEQAAQQLDGDQLRGALANRKALADAVASYDVTVNPRYRPLEFPLLSFQGDAPAVVVPLGEGDPGTVIDAR
jgi:hypothetical protein